MVEHSPLKRVVEGSSPSRVIIMEDKIIPPFPIRDTPPTEEEKKIIRANMIKLGDKLLQESEERENAIFAKQIANIIRIEKGREHES